MIHNDRVLTSRSHLPRLDGLRGVAIVLVLLHSLTLLKVVDSIPAHITYNFFAFGWIGVQLFFVLSGFLITGILLDERHSPHYFRNFYARRSLRIFPLYYATLVVAFILLPTIGQLPAVYQHDANNQARLWLYLTNWSTDIGIGFSHYWSLALEEQFYLIWPLAIYHLSNKNILRICLGMAIIGLGIRFWMRTHGFPEEAVYISTPSRVDALTSGSAIAVLLRMPAALDIIRTHKRTIYVTTLIVGALTLPLASSFATSISGQVFGYSVLTSFFCLLVLLAVIHDLDQAPSNGTSFLLLKPIRIFGKYSYGMYVFQRQIHVFIGIPLIERYAAKSLPINILYIATASLLTLGISVVSYHLLESPFLRMKKKFTN